MATHSIILEVESINWAVQEEPLASAFHVGRYRQLPSDITTAIY